MTYEDIMKFYDGSVRKLAEDLDCTTQCIYMWKRGRVPRLAQYKLERISKGKLKVDPDFPRKKTKPEDRPHV